MKINKIIKQVVLSNKEMLNDINSLNCMNDLNARLLEVIKLIDKYGNHPKLIIQLIINIGALQESDDFYPQIVINNLNKVFKSSLAASDDSELILEYYYFLFAAGKKELMPKLLKNKISLILNDIEEIKQQYSEDKL